MAPRVAIAYLLIGEISEQSFVSDWERLPLVSTEPGDGGKRGIWLQIHKVVIVPAEEEDVAFESLAGVFPGKERGPVLREQGAKDLQEPACRALSLDSLRLRAAKF